ncbi:MAG: hypothetical protein E7531_06070 [Ruminococcaceae bacterium]|nr:hypothetical protein [Oscillospiraceae bacterium]
MNREELIQKAEKYIEDYYNENGITRPMVNAAEVVEQLVSFWEPTQEEYEFWAKKMLSLQLREGTKGYEKMKQELIDYWKETPYTDEPIIRSFPNQNGEPEGSVANSGERWLCKPADWKNRIKLAQKMR